MKTNEQLAEECPAFGPQSDCNTEQLVIWIADIRREAFKAGQQYAMKWVSEECKRATERLTNATIEIMMKS